MGIKTKGTKTPGARPDINFNCGFNFCTVYFMGGNGSVKHKYGGFRPRQRFEMDSEEAAGQKFICKG